MFGSKLRNRAIPKFLWPVLWKRSVHSTVRKVKSRRPGHVNQLGLSDPIVDKPPTYYATIEEKLSRINYHDHPTNQVNIGFARNSTQYENFVKVSTNFHKGQEVVTTEDEDGLSELDKPKNVQLDSETYSRLWRYNQFTEDYLDSTISLAHHYSIFRDLFYDAPFQPHKNTAVIEANGRNEFNSSAMSSSELFYFTPLVTIDAEFALDNDSDALCLRAYRGNLITPEYGAQCPSIAINSSAIHGHLDISDSFNSPVSINSGNEQDAKYYSLALVNLDSHFTDSGVCHLLLCNIHREASETKYETVIKYLPVYGIRGFGYHRYVFVLYQHNHPLSQENKIVDFDLGKRKFNGLKFMQNALKLDSKLSIKPVGLSWFQTTWNSYCTDVFNKFLEMKSPTYEYVFPKQISQFKQLQYPGRAPFNKYLDSFRDPKEIAKSVLLERLKSINPFESYDSKKMYPSWDGKPSLPHIYPFAKGTPDWLKSDLIKKRERTGVFRGLRAPSATLPHNNNADLDQPKWPRVSSDKWPLNSPNPYPDGHRRPKPLRETLWSKPLPEHHSLRIDHSENLKEDDKINLEKTATSD